MSELWWRIKILQLDSHAHFKLMRGGYECHPDESSRIIMRLADFEDFVRTLGAAADVSRAVWVRPYGKGSEFVRWWLEQWVDDETLKRLSGESEASEVDGSDLSKEEFDRLEKSLSTRLEL